MCSGRSLRRWCATVPLIAVACVLPAQQTAAVVDSLVSARLADIVSHGELASLRWPGLPDITFDLRRVYDATRWSPIWTRDGVPTASARATIEALAAVDSRGLEPRDYDAGRLRALAGTRLSDANARAEFDATLSVASLRVVLALRTGRISAREAHAHLRFPRDSVDVAAALLSLASSPDPSAVFDSHEPPYRHYQLLKRALATFRTRALTDSTAITRVRQIALTLERWRWLPHQFSTTPIIVNIPAFRLNALAANSDREADALSMDVVVGDAYGHRTPVFSDMLEYIVFAPYWDVPTSIALTELLPRARRDPHMLTVNNYEIVNSREQVLKNSAASVRAVAAGTARIRQLPGGTNALGRVKFVFPNEFNVYMHDTPVQAAFKRDRRDISHGCIRLANPAALARRVLRDQPAWDSTAIEAAMQAREPRRVDLTTGIPVHIVYATVVAREDGTVNFYEDIYGHDAALAAQLARGYPYRR